MLEQINKILAADYGLTGNLQELVAYQDKNFILITDNGEKYVVKVTTSPDEIDFVQAQDQAFELLSDPAICKPLARKNGLLQSRIDLHNNSLPLRVFSFVEGPFLNEFNPELSFYSDFGRLLGKMDHELARLKDPVLLVQNHAWDLARFQELKPLLNLVSDIELKRTIHFFFMRHKEEVLSIYHLLPKSLIHNDANDWNVIVDQDKHCVKGLIDFGDMVYTARIHELAIALAYALMDRSNFDDILYSLVQGYVSVYPLSPTELDALYYLVVARLCTSALHAAKQAHDQPGSAYHQVSAKPAEDLLQKWIRVNPIHFKNIVFKAAGLDHPREVTDIPNEIDRQIKKRHTMMSKSQSVSYANPIEMIGSGLQYMYAADGKTYLDCVNNIPHVGHCHPVVVEAGQKQVAKLNTNTRYIYESLNTYAEKLLKTFPDSLSKVFFVNSGSAATDLAVRLAKNHTGRENFQVLDHAYHGNTSTAMALSPYKFNGKGGLGRPDNTEIVGAEAYQKSRLKAYGLGRMGRLKEEGRSESQNHGITESPVPAGFVAESIPGCAGQVVLDAEFMQNKVQEVQQNGGLYIADEVQTGFARVGEHFWGFELYDVVPDIVILGKPIANGHPMGAVVCTDEIAQSFETGMEFFSSFGGNPVSCEIANAVLDVITHEKLQDNAQRVGSYILQELKGLIKHQASNIEPRTSVVSDVRGSGLFIGIELITDLKSMKPDAQMASTVVNQMKEQGFLLSVDGPDENVIKFKPPMCFSLDNAKDLVENLKSLLR